MATREELVQYARNTAVRAGTDPDAFVRQIQQESGFNANAHNAASGADGIAQIVVASHPTMAGKTRDPFASLDYAANLVAENTRIYGTLTKALIAYNWGPGNMQRNWNGTFEDLPRETQQYLRIIVGEDRARKELGQAPGTVVNDGGAVRIGPDVPDSVIRQQDDWSCSVRSSWGALWILQELGAIGFNGRTYADWLATMAPKYANSDVGLKDGSGAGLAEALRSWGVKACHAPGIARASVIEEIRKGNLVLVGGHQWGPAGHWALVVGVELDGTLILENPAGCYSLGGTRICDQIRDSWSKSSWSAVVIEVPQAAPAEPPAGVPDARDEQLSELIAQLAWANTLVGEAYNHDGSIRRALAKTREMVGHVVAAIEAIEDALEQHATKPQPTDPPTGRAA